MSDSPTSDRLDRLRAKLRAFVAERDWAQFHNPKNLAMALVAEAGELVEHFQWLTAEQADRLPPETLARSSTSSPTCSSSWSSSPTG